MTVKVQVTGENGFSVENCASISEGGMLLRIGKRSYQTGDRVVLNFLVPGASTYTVTGEVIYVRKTRVVENQARTVGILFIAPPTALQDAIKRFVEA